MKKLILVALLAVIVAVPVFAQANPAQTVPFDHWAYDAVDQLVQKGIIIGYPDGTFKGDRAMTRYEFAMAISRLLDVVAAQKGEKGETGARGDQGPQGLPGAAGLAGARGAQGERGPVGPDGKIDEARIAALVNKLCDEFKAELKDLRGDVDALTDDVADLTDRVSAIEEQLRGPKVFGWIDYRMAMVGDDVDFAATTDNMTAMVGIQGRITDDLSGRVALKVRDSDAAISGFNPVVPAPPPYPFFNRVDSSFVPFLPGFRGAETIWLDEAVLVANSRFLTPATWTFGRQFQSYGMGLLVNNERMSQQGVRLQLNDVMNSNVNLDTFFGGVAGWLSQPASIGDPYNFATDLSGRSDLYFSARASYSRPSWALGVNYLQSGVDDEQGWSADLAAQVWNRDVRVEYAMQEKNAFGTTIPGGNEAWMASADIWRGSNWRLTGFYSKAGGQYDPQYSALHPYFEAVDRAETGFVPWVPWEKWLRNPLVERGYETFGGHLDFSVGSFPFTVAYFDRDGTGFTEAYDQLWAVGVSKQLADGITANVTYGFQRANLPVFEDQKLLQASVTVGF